MLQCRPGLAVIWFDDVGAGTESRLIGDVALRGLVKEARTLAAPQGTGQLSPQPLILAVQGTPLQVQVEYIHTSACLNGPWSEPSTYCASHVDYSFAVVR